MFKRLLTIACSLGLFTLQLSTVSVALAQENVVVVLDDSGSMNERMSDRRTRIDAAKKALSTLLPQFHNDTKLGLLLLNGAQEHQHWAIPLGTLSSGKAVRISQSLLANGGTPLGERMRDGADALLKLREKQVYGTYRLLIVTDGEANDGRLLLKYLPDVLSRGLIVDVIGVDMKQDHTLAKHVHSYRRADDDAALSKAIQEVFAEKVDSNASNAQDDYALLSGIDSDTAKQVLTALSKPNNSSINESAWPELWDGPQRISGQSWAGTLVAGLLTCFVPVAIFVFVLSAIFGRSKKRQIRGR
jgi:hypothetical protein